VNSQGTPAASQGAQAAGEMVTISRVLDAPPELVYRAFVDPDELAQWWGPEGNWAPRETIESDPRPGGHLRIREKSSELPGLEAPIEITFAEVVENELLAGDMVVNRPALPDWPAAVIRTSLRLEFHPEPGGRTRLEIRHGPFAGRELDGTLQGWGEQLGKLSRHLLASQNG
jgi:uncharacterized protein YndB with AHSA1/START domain